jgi:hypothetical protein
MHTIDLLKGQGTPARTTFAGTIIIAVTVIVPILIFAVMLDSYLQNRLDIDNMNREITRFQNKVDEFAPQVKQYSGYLKQKSQLTGQLSEISRCVNTFVQWSPMFIAVAQKLPSKLVLNSLSAQSKYSRPAIVEEKDKDKPAEIPVPERTMLVETSGRDTGNYDVDARDYLGSLKGSEAIAGKLNREDFTFGPGGVGSQQTIIYKMNFIFKTQSK